MLVVARWRSAPVMAEAWCGPSETFQTADKVHVTLVQARGVQWQVCTPPTPSQ